MINVGLTNVELNKAKELLRSIPGAAEAACANALNEAAHDMREGMTTYVAENYYVFPQEVRRTIRIRRAFKTTRLAIDVTARGKGISLAGFKITPANPMKRLPQFPRSNPKLAVQIGPRNAFQAHPEAFALTKKTRGEDASPYVLFKRIGKHRKSIQFLVGPSVPELMGSKRNYARIEALGRARLQHHLDRQIAGMLSGEIEHKRTRT